jgi:hypothetical protein
MNGIAHDRTGGRSMVTVINVTAGVGAVPARAAGDECARS